MAGRIAGRIGAWRSAGSVPPRGGLPREPYPSARLGPSSILVTDAGSTKARIVEGVEADSRGRASFVGAHPIAGSERQGVAHAVFLKARVLSDVLFQNTNFNASWITR